MEWPPVTDDRGVICDIQRFSLHDGPGIRTTVFLKGCTLRCCWCANPESQDRRRQIMYSSAKCVLCGLCESSCPLGAIRWDPVFGIVFDHDVCDLCGICVQNCPQSALHINGEIMSCSEVLREIEKDTLFYRKSGGGATFSGGEPLMQAAFLHRLLCACKSAGIGTAIETAGNVPWGDIERILPVCDLFLFDIKRMDSNEHEDVTGAPNARILENLRMLGRTDSRVCIRVPVVPGYCGLLADVPAIADIAMQVRGLEKIDLLPYHKLGMSKYSKLGMGYIPDQHLEPPNSQFMDELKQSLERALPGVRLEVR